ncbi:uncharacterized protein B0H18DRAFT_1029064, partial [Fomitopsis serialis]|uniref:uncharacterized protein n=1 Tax=Fomitopsis serialis TaxID=139415 RepID=UPI002008170D
MAFAQRRSPLTHIVVVLQFCGLVLLTALLATPAHRHPIVNGIVGLSIIRCIVGIVPATIYLSSPRYRASLDNLQQHAGWARFCVADSLLLNYITIAKSAFAISFTLGYFADCYEALCYLAWKFTSNHRDRLETQNTPQFFKRTIIVLCVGPFLWALPVILAPEFIRSDVCVVNNNVAQILALLLTLIPLTVAVIASMMLLFVLWKYYKLPDLRHSFELLHPLRIVRFAALVSTIIVLQFCDLECQNAFEAWLKTSFTWESVSPLIFFLIFAAQEEIYSVWWQWIRRWLPHRSFKSSRFDETTMSPSSKKDSCNRRPFYIFAWLSGHRNHADQEDPDHYDSAVVLSKARDNHRAGRSPQGQIMHISYAPFTPSHDLRGLPPPPRHQRSRSQSPRESAVFRAVPSLSALGPKRRATSESRKQPVPSQLLDHKPGAGKGLRLTPSDEGRSKGEVSSWAEEFIGGMEEHSRPASAAGGAVDALDLQGRL